MTGDLGERIWSASHLTGEFKLRSGTVSSEYFDKYRFEADPALLREVAEAVVALLPSDADALAGLELGGVPIAVVVSQLTGLPTRYVRRQPKQYGTSRRCEGGEVAGLRVVVIEDVVTTGGVVLDTVAALRRHGAHIATAICVVDREAGGLASLAAAGIELRSVFRASELKSASES